MQNRAHSSKRLHLCFKKWLFCVLSVCSGMILFAQSLLPERIVRYSCEQINFSGLCSFFSLTEAVSSDNVGDVQQGQAKLFGVLPVKKIEIENASVPSVYVSGEPYGMKIYSDGVIVVGMTDVDTAEGNRNPAKEAGICVGDYISAINGEAVQNNAHAASLLENSDGEPISITVKRDKRELQFTLTPAFSVSASVYKAGIWIRDSAAGLGMMTFILPNGVCAGLGHGVKDSEAGVMISVAGGSLCSVKLIDIVKGKCGTPGQLSGCLESGGINGIILQNTNTGLYGRLTEIPANAEPYSVAAKQEAKIGAAEIITTVENGNPMHYQIKIEKINYRGTQNFVIKVTDEALLSATGGIVQGNSGSPIIQNGKLIGAVTHVFVNDPSRGYGIFAETMVEKAQSLSIENQAA